MKTYDCQRIGVISDTHGIMRPGALQVLRGVELILHAGDVGEEDILTELEQIAPVLAVRGNCDYDAWAGRLPIQRTLQVQSVIIAMRHILEDYVASPIAGAGVVITGHTHRPKIEEVDGVLYLNPGSAGPKRFSLPITLSILEIAGAEPSARLVEIQ